MSGSSFSPASRRRDESGPKPERLRQRDDTWRAFVRELPALIAEDTAARGEESFTVTFPRPLDAASLRLMDALGVTVNVQELLSSEDCRVPGCEDTADTNGLCGFHLRMPNFRKFARPPKPKEEKVSKVKFPRECCGSKGSRHLKDCPLKNGETEEPGTKFLPVEGGPVEPGELPDRSDEVKGTYPDHVAATREEHDPQEAAREDGPDRVEPDRENDGRFSLVVEKRYPDVESIGETENGAGDAEEALTLLNALNAIEEDPRVSKAKQLLDASVALHRAEKAYEEAYAALALPAALDDPLFHE